MPRGKYCSAIYALCSFSAFAEIDFQEFHQRQQRCPFFAANKIVDRQFISPVPQLPACFYDFRCRVYVLQNLDYHPLRIQQLRGFGPQRFFVHIHEGFCRTDQSFHVEHHQTVHDHTLGCHRIRLESVFLTRPE